MTEDATSSETTTTGLAERELPEGPVLLFDGVCNLCNQSVQLVIANERFPELRFVQLQSELGERLLTRAFGAAEAKRLLHGTTGAPDSVVLVEGTRGWTHSDAALRVARRLRAPYRWLAAAVIVPRALRDVVYRWIARHRYRWFGKSESCWVPTPELRARFL